MSESVENLSSDQTTFTFCRQSSKDNPQNMFESVVDTPINDNTPDIKMETSQKSNKISLEELYQQKKKVEVEQKMLENTQESNNYEQSDYASLIKQKKDYLAASDQQSDEIHEFHSYMDLTSKLQSALNKISRSKRSGTTTNRCSNIIMRFEELEEKKKQEMMRLKEERELQTIREVKSKPTINKNSGKIAQETGYQPIHIRYQKITQAKKKQMEINEQLKLKQLQEKQAQFFEQFQKHFKRPDNIRSYEQYFNQMVKWKERRTQENRLKFEKKRGQEIQGLSFQPTISNKSKKIMQSKQRLPISQRGLVRQKIKPLYTFTPKINNTRQPK